MTGAERSIELQPRVCHAVALAVCAALLLPLSAESAIYSTSYSYDVPNGIVTRTDPNGTGIAYHYNAVNKLSKVVLDTGGSAAEFNYQYDLTDQLTRQTYPGGEQLYTYDEFDRLQTVSDFGAGALLQFSYDHRDRVTWIVYTGSNGAVCYEYDPDGRITRVGRVFSGSGSVCSAADEKTDYGYDAQGRLISVRYPNGIQGYVQYDEAGRIRTTGYRRSNGTLVYSDSFEYVPGSRLYAGITRTTAIESHRTAYTYDAWERLLSVTESDGRKTEYEYDPFGNRTRERITHTLDPEATGGAPKAYGDYVYEYPEKSNRLSRVLKDGVPFETYTYDNAGRLTQRVHATEGTSTYAYDARGLLTQVTKPGTSISYTYDALGARKSKTVNGATTKYLTAPVFGMSRVVAELNDNLSLKATYVYGGQQLLKEEPTSGNRDHDVYLLSDGIVGSITHATDDSGQIKDEYRYDAFGIRSTTSQTSNSHGHYGYTGQEYDEEAGLLYLRARYYDPQIGRFISADPFWGRLEEPASQNRYAYVHNNPLIYADPSGLAVGDWWDLPANFTRAKEIALEELEIRPASHNDIGDAMRHAEWMRRTTEETNTFTAWIAGTGHEISGLFGGQPISEAVMDLHNNAVGRDAGSTGTSVDTSQLWVIPLRENQYNPYQDVCK